VSPGGAAGRRRMARDGIRRRLLEDGADAPGAGWGSASRTRRGTSTSCRAEGNAEAADATYLRRSFVVEDPARFKELRLDLLAEERVAVYLNGREIYRSPNLPKSGPVDIKTLKPLRRGISRHSSASARRTRRDRGREKVKLEKEEREFLVNNGHSACWPRMEQSEWTGQKLREIMSSTLPEVLWEIPVDPACLKRGSNVLAAELYCAGADVVRTTIFDAHLRAPGDAFAVPMLSAGSTRGRSRRRGRRRRNLS